MSDAARPEIELRAAREEDLARVIALLADDPLGAAREDYRDPLPEAYLEGFRDIAAYRGNVVLVAEAGGEVIGCLQLTVIPGLTRRGMKRGQIEGVRIAAGWRGRKLGEMLVRRAVELAREDGCGLVQLTTDNTRPQAHRFYEGLGFVGSHLGMKLMLS